MPIYLSYSLATCNSCVRNKKHRFSNSQHRRCLSARQPLNVSYTTLYQNIGLLLANHSEYWQHGAISYNKTQSQLRRTNEQAVVHKVSRPDKQRNKLRELEHKCLAKELFLQRNENGEKLHGREVSRREGYNVQVTRKGFKFTNCCC